MAFDWNQFVSNFGMGMLGQPNLAASIGGGAANVGQNMQYQNLLQKLMSPGTPNPVQVTPQQTGPTPQAQPAQNQLPAFSDQGLLSGSDPRIANLLGSLQASQGQPIVSSLLSNAISPHPITHETLPNGQIQDYDWLGHPVGAPHGMLALKNNESYLPDPNAPPGSGPSMPSLAGPPQGNGGAPMANIPPAESVAPLLLQKIPGARVTSEARTPAQNAAVNGVSDSAHLQDHAIDFVAPANESPAQIQAAVGSLGLPGAKAIYEGPGAANSTAPHWHVQWGTPGGVPSPQPQAPAQMDAYGRPMPGYYTADSPVGKANGGHSGWITPERTFKFDENSPEGINQKIAVSTAEARARYTAPLDTLKETDPNYVDRTAKAIAEYRMKPPQSITGRQNVVSSAIMDKVLAMNPTFDSKNYDTAQKALKDFSTGKQGDIVRSFNVGMQHLDLLSQAGQILQNGNVRLPNALKNAIQNQLGVAAPNSFNAVRDIVGDEIVKAIIGSKGGQGDRTQIQATVNNDMSKMQLSDVINKYKGLMAGQLGGLKQQYEQSTGRNDFTRFLSPQAQSLLHSGQGPMKIGRFTVTTQ